MNSDKFKKQIESMWKHRDTDEQKRLVKFTIAKTMRLTLEYPELAQEYFDSLCKVIPDNERITISNYQHNLTSDAEGEEMLTCEKSRVQQQYKRATQLKDDSDPKWELVGDQMERVLIGLFGSKCLPDVPSKLQASCRQVNVDSSHDNVDSSHGNVDSLEPKPAEPKYHKDDKVLYNGAVHKITVGYGDGRYLLNNTQKVVKESDLEPYTEPEKEVVKMRLTTSKVSVYLATKEEDEEFRLLLHENGFRWNSGDPLINNACWNSYTEESKIYYFYPDKTVTYWGDKTSETLTFSEFKKQFFEEKPRKLSQETANCDYPVPDRLHIAAMAMQGLLSNADRMKMYEDVASYPLSDNLTRIVARNALRYADTLVAEAHKPTPSLRLKSEDSHEYQL